MTVEEMQAQLDKMKDDIEHMKVRVSEYEHMISVIKAQDDESFERLPKGENYFMVIVDYGNGKAITEIIREDYDYADNARFDNNNYFKTSERTEEVADKINFLLKLERFHDRFCPNFVPDWDDFNSCKYMILYDHDHKIYKYMYCYSTEQRTLAFFPSEEIAKKVCDILNKERENNG